MIEQLRLTFALVCLFSLSGCASTAQVSVSLPPPQVQPQSERPLPPPGSFRKRGDCLLREAKGQTLDPGCTTSGTKPTTSETTSRPVSGT